MIIVSLFRNLFLVFFVMSTILYGFIMTRTRNILTVLKYMYVFNLKQYYGHILREYCKETELPLKHILNSILLQVADGLLK